MTSVMLPSSQIVLREISLSQYVALGGSGCSAVCAGTAFIAASVRLPYLSYECAGATLSDTTEYDDFTRMGTVTSQAPTLIQEIGGLVADWSFIAIVSGDPAKYRPEADALEIVLMRFDLTAIICSLSISPGCDLIRFNTFIAFKGN